MTLVNINFWQMGDDISSTMQKYLTRVFAAKHGKYQLNFAENNIDNEMIATSLSEKTPACVFQIESNDNIFTAITYFTSLLTKEKPNTENNKFHVVKDEVTLPFDINDLAQKTSNILQNIENKILAQNNIIHLSAALSLDKFKKSLQKTDGQDNILLSIELTEKEVDLLGYLHENSNESDGYISAELILKNVWQYDENMNTHTLPTHIYRLRNKLLKLENELTIASNDNGYRLTANN